MRRKKDSIETGRKCEVKSKSTSSKSCGKKGKKASSEVATTKRVYQKRKYTKKQEKCVPLRTSRRKKNYSKSPTFDDILTVVNPEAIGMYDNNFNIKNISTKVICLHSSKKCLKNFKESNYDFSTTVGRYKNSDNDSVGKGSAGTRKGTLKYKRMRLDKLLDNEREYEDDFLWHRKDELAKDFALNDSEVSELSCNISTPDNSLNVSIKKTKKAPTFKDVFNSEELAVFRKSAMEYNLRRENWIKNNSEKMLPLDTTKL